MKRLITFVGLLTAILITASAQYTFDVQVAGKGKPMLLIPGLTCAGAVWDETLEELGDGYQYHVVTLPGFAGHPSIKTDNYLQSVGNELISYLKDNEIDKPIIMGHSLGGFLSLYIGTKEPNLASRLIVVDALAFMGASQNPMATPETMKNMAEMMRKNIKEQSPEQFEQMQPMILRSMMQSEEKIGLAMEWARESDPEVVAQAMYELYQFDLREEVQSIEVPTLVLGAWVGYKDYGVTKEMTARSFAINYQHLKGVEIKLSDKGKHFIMWDDPEFFFAQVKGFLNEKS